MESLLFCKPLVILRHHIFQCLLLMLTSYWANRSVVPLTEFENDCMLFGRVHAYIAAIPLASSRIAITGLSVHDGIGALKSDASKNMGLILIQRYGFSNPIGVKGDELIKGNGAEVFSCCPNSCWLPFLPISEFNKTLHSEESSGLKL
ncbi:hypothetical protein Peur_018847 [Populus x canadensis]